jgi:hypothetical protein
MRWYRKLGLGLALLAGSPLLAVAQPQADKKTEVIAPPPAVVESAPAAEAPSSDPLGPTPLTNVKILQNALFGEDDKPMFRIAGWLSMDYTYNSGGHGLDLSKGPGVAPVMNRFGDEFLLRQAGIYLWKPLDPNCLSFGFNAIFLAGADASFLTPTNGGWRNTDPRFGTQFTDLNVTAHLPILTEGGVDVKAGRQTTILGPMGALAWQRPFTSSDYAWYNLEEGRYTGVSTVWHINKQLDWYNGVELGGWGTFYSRFTPADWITNISYWLDCEAKRTKVWTTVLTGATSYTPNFRGENSTVLELGVQHNFNEYWYIIVDSQMVWSKAPVANQPVSAGYNEQAYDVYTYIGRHINCNWDVTFRAEWYRDVNGLGYPGGFGVPDTDYWALTFGPNYHPNKWLEIRPEVRWDNASNPNLGANHDRRDIFTFAVEALIKF